MKPFDRFREWWRRIRARPAVTKEEIADRAEIEREILRLEERLLLVQRRFELRNR